jgi:hypothetical protein
VKTALNCIALLLRNEFLYKTLVSKRRASYISENIPKSRLKILICLIKVFSRLTAVIFDFFNILYSTEFSAEFLKPVDFPWKNIPWVFHRNKFRGISAENM